MKKAIILAMAAMMILGSIKALASEDMDLNPGKWDQAEDTLLEMDIHRDITEGKIAAAELQTAMASIRNQITHLYNLQNDLSDFEETNGLIKKIGMTADQAETALKAIDDSLDLGLAKKVDATLKKDIERIQREMTAFLSF